jgi:hypothetical protein
MEHVIKLLGAASGHPTNLEGQYLKSYDPEAFDGRGDVVATPLKEYAMRFDSFSQAHAFWNQQSKTRPLRPDGKPNKPLTAFTIEIIKA